MKIAPLLSTGLIIALTLSITNFSFPVHWDEPGYLMNGYLAVHQHISNHGILDGIQYIFSVPWLISGIAIDSPLINSPFLIDHEYPSRIFTEYFYEAYKSILERSRQLSLIISMAAIGIACYFFASSSSVSLKKNCALTCTALAIFVFAMPNIKLIYSSVLIEPYVLFIIGLSVYYLCTPNANIFILIILITAPFFIKLSLIPVALFCTIKFAIENKHKGFKKIAQTLLMGLLILYLVELLIVLRQPIFADPQLQNLHQQIGIITQYGRLNKIIFYLVAPLDRLFQIANFVKVMLANGSLDFYWNGDIHPRNLITKFYFLCTNFNFIEVLLIASSPMLSIAMCYFERKNIRLLLVSLLFTSISIPLVILNNSFSAHYYAAGGIISLICLVYFLNVNHSKKIQYIPFLIIIMTAIPIQMIDLSSPPKYFPLLIDSGERMSAQQNLDNDKINFGSALNNRYHMDLLENMKQACLKNNTNYRISPYDNKYEFTVAKYFLSKNDSQVNGKDGFIEGKLDCNLVSALFTGRRTLTSQKNYEIKIIECEAAYEIPSPLYLINSCGEECQKYNPYPTISYLDNKYYYLFTSPKKLTDNSRFIPPYDNCKFSKTVQ